MNCDHGTTNNVVCQHCDTEQVSLQEEKEKLEKLNAEKGGRFSVLNTITRLLYNFTPSIHAVLGYTKPTNDGRWRWVRNSERVTGWSGNNAQGVSSTYEEAKLNLLRGWASNERD